MQALLERLAPYLDRLRDFWDQLPEERQRQARIGGLAGGILLFFLVIVLPLVASRFDALSARDRAAEQWREMRRLEVQARELGLHEQEDAAAEPETDEARSLLSTLDRIARRVDVSKNVQSMRPRGSGDDREVVAIELTDLVLEEFAKLLYQLEVEQDRLRVERFDLTKDRRDPKRLRAKLEVAR